MITPNPKTSGGARWNYLAAWAWASQQYRDGDKVLDYMTKLFHNVPVLDTGARGATTTFVERGIGDVLVAWENEALLTLNDPETRGKYEIVVPSLSIKAEPPVAWVDKNVARHGTRKQAETYLRFLYYTAEGAASGREALLPAVRTGPGAASERANFPTVKWVTIDGAFGGWKRRRPRTSPTAGCSTRSCRPRAERGPA